MRKISVLFVCLGNICRSPTAHGIFEGLVKTQGLQQQIEVDSAGTGDWHLGRAPDPRATEHASQRGYDLTHLRARLVTAADFEHFDYVLAMDNENLVNLEMLRPEHYQGHLGLFLKFSGRADYSEVPDPYFGGDSGFQLVLDLVEEASEGLLRHIKDKHL